MAFPWMLYSIPLKTKLEAVIMLTFFAFVRAQDCEKQLTLGVTLVFFYICYADALLGCPLLCLSTVLLTCDSSMHCAELLTSECGETCDMND